MTTVISESERAVSESSRPVACRHCGQDVPAGLLPAPGSQAEAFCCHGCEAAYALLAGAGLDDFYRHREVEGAVAGRRAETSETYEEFDDPSFEARHVQQLGPRTRRVELKLEGIHCRACVWLLERLPQLQPAVLESRLNLHRESLTLVWDSQLATLAQIAGTLDRLGYRPHPKETAADEMAERAEQRRRLTDIAIAAALAGNLMLIAVALYAGWWTGMDPSVTTFFRWVSAILGTVSILGPGRTFFVHAWQGLKARVPNMDIPIALGLGAGAIAGVVNTITGWGEIYFDSLGMLVLLLLIGRWVQFRQHRRAARMIRRLYEVTPRRARRRERDGGTKWVPVSALQPGDVMQVLAGETIPADGVVVSGRSALDRSLLTGESVPMEIDVDQTVHAGMNNLEAPLEIRVTAIGPESRLGKLIDLIEEATLRRTPIVRRADRMSGWFVTGVLIATVGTAIYWAWKGDEAYLDHAIALAIVSCPCALAMATPLSIAVAIGRAARSGLLVKGGDTLERLASAGTLWLDKTGTLTEGRSQVRSWVGDEANLGTVAALEAQSSHRVARAIVAFAESRGVLVAGSEVSPAHAGTRQAETGGISGEVQGREWRIGNLKFVAASGAVEGRWERWTRWVARQGCTPVLVSVDGRVVSGIAVGDRVRPEAAAVLGRFRRAGWRIGILSGDHPQVVASVARSLGVEPEMALGGLAPEEKVARVRESAAVARPDAPVMMVGDGMNDGAALAAADVGVSMQSSAEVSLETADVHLGREGLVPLLDLIAGARGTVRTIHIGLVVSLAYNLVAVSLAATGWINPLLAALLMPVSSLTVIGLAVGGRGFRRPPSTCRGSEGAACPAGVEGV